MTTLPYTTRVQLRGGPLGGTSMNAEGIAHGLDLPGLVLGDVGRPDDRVGFVRRYRPAPTLAENGDLVLLYCGITLYVW